MYKKYHILNLVLGCQLTVNGFTKPHVFNNPSLESLIGFWNSSPNKWECVHYPCILEHFELQEVIGDE